MKVKDALAGLLIAAGLIVGGRSHAAAAPASHCAAPYSAGARHDEAIKAQAPVRAAQR